MDRQILNPIPENSRCFSISDSTLSLAHACLLGQVYIRPDQDLIIGSDDLKDFYHGFVISERHAARNHIHGVFRGSEFRGFNAYRPELDDQPVVGCFRSLAMGTSYAVDTAQHAHTVLLRRARCLKSSEQVAYRHPFPRGPGFELLCIDDHAYLRLVSKLEARKAPDINRADIALFARAGRMYVQAGLRTSPKKAIRNAYRATVLGGQIDGEAGTLSAPKLKTTVLCALTFQLAVLGVSTKEILSSIVGSWVFVAMFRRPFMCLITELYHEIARHRDGEVFALSHDARQELLLLTLFAPCMSTDLRARPLDRVFCTDASSYAAGACESPMKPGVCLELLRHADHKGFHTQLKPQVASYLEHFSLPPGLFDDSPENIPRTLTEGILYDVCEVFRSGSNFSAVFKDRGFCVHPGFDLAVQSDGDSAHSTTMLHIIGLICRRVVAYFHIALGCRTFGNMYRPRVRSKTIPAGFDPSHRESREDTQLARRAAFLLHLCAAHGLAASCEQPLGSVMYRLSVYRRLLSQGFCSFKVTFCSFGTPYKHTSHWLVNRSGPLSLSCRCTCPPAEPHLRIEASFSRGSLEKFKSRCKPNCLRVFGHEPKLGQAVRLFSEAYPVPFLEQLADCMHPHILELKSTVCDSQRPAHVPPRWIGDLGSCLSWRVLLQYRFKRQNHININEELSLRSLIKHVGKTSPSSRFGVLLDSRVVIGCNAKGRSSSQKLNFYLSTALPYLAGCNLYPYYFHVGTRENASDDPSRLTALRATCAQQPLWLRQFLDGNFTLFDIVRRADNCARPLDGWARLAALSVALDLLDAPCQAP